MSRLARSCRDWHQLLEICALSGTLIADTDGICDPRNYNDRLLLGLKGTMSEAELHLLKNRMDEGRRSKAQGGELFRLLPCGRRGQPRTPPRRSSDLDVPAGPLVSRLAPAARDLRPVGNLDRRHRWHLRS